MKFTQAKDTQTASVYQGEHLVGTLQRTSHGSLFKYSEDADVKKIGSLCGIAFSIPLKNKSVSTSGVNLHPFFTGLLPEGLRLKALTRAVKTSQDDLFSLLLASGTDSIGDISVTTKDEFLEDVWPELEIDAYGPHSFSQVLRKSLDSFDKEFVPKFPSIPGVQDKISASMISIPVRIKNKSSMHILKLSPKDMPLLVQNEDFFLSLAKSCGLRVPNHRLIQDKQGQWGLLIQRFDRLGKKGQKPKKLHMEDACQFLNKYPSEKYRISCRTIAEGILELSSAPLVDLSRFIQLVAFSYLMANGDLHARNISLMESPDGKRIELTPAYDLICTLPYGDRKMALAFEGRDDNIKRSDFISFGKRLGLREAAIDRMLGRMIKIVSEHISRLGNLGYRESKTKDMARVIAKRLEDLAH